MDKPYWVIISLGYGEAVINRYDTLKEAWAAAERVEGFYHESVNVVHWIASF